MRRGVPGHVTHCSLFNGWFQMRCMYTPCISQLLFLFHDFVYFHLAFLFFFVVLSAMISSMWTFHIDCWIYMSTPIVKLATFDASAFMRPLLINIHARFSSRFLMNSYWNASVSIFFFSFPLLVLFFFFVFFRLFHFCSYWLEEACYGLL